jgi:hypothetical protein
MKSNRVHRESLELFSGVGPESELTPMKVVEVTFHVRDESNSCPFDDV